ncbi:lysylphosphatidylglycerol synthase domain-containing protein [Actomonas aquatica]|uniref:Lysylphosphatidylglycerol synthase domain-containing protein n=1 Tax=Actomonas aquatica TaxID=2866162 RepID=A0ABZ1C7T6_9BACT|nr:lysylphosphatidylglycerol synthase domain-containing protein [Opitutus sp. WL0086]WRQ87338.1 lysylphosphatidylglycerol synthase domain-containing protein [Opitutus sp. WL0086]
MNTPAAQSSRAEVGWRWAKRLGSVVALASGGWVLWQGAQGLRSQDVVLDWARLLPVVVIGVGLWVALNALLGAAWAGMVRLLGGEVRTADSVRLAWRVQVAKYLPGNVFHYAGRVALAGEVGVRKTVAVVATAAEPVLQLAVACAAVAVVVPVGLRGDLPWPVLGVALVGCLGVVALAAVILRRRLAKAGVQPRWRVGSALAVVGSHLGVMVIQTLMFQLVVSRVGGGWEADGLTLFGVVVVSWTAGLVVIGAPGGIGVRELTLAVLAERLGAPGEVVAVAAVLTRLAAVAGDVSSAALARWWPSKE